MKTENMPAENGGALRFDPGEGQSQEDNMLCQCSCAEKGELRGGGCSHLHGSRCQQRSGQRCECLCELVSLRRGQRAMVRRVSARGELGRRLRDMGLMPGVCLTMCGPAPLGDPVSVSLEGYDLSLRNTEAAQVLVEAMPQDAAARRERSNA